MMHWPQLAHTCQTQTCGKLLPVPPPVHHEYSLATHAKPYSVGSRYRTSSTNCDDPVHGSGPGEIVLYQLLPVPPPMSAGGVALPAAGGVALPATGTSRRSNPFSCRSFMEPLIRDISLFRDNIERILA